VSRPSTNRASAITDCRASPPRPCYISLGRQPTEQVRSRSTMPRTLSTSRPSTDRASAITPDREHAIVVHRPVSVVNQPSKRDHARLSKMRGLQVAGRSVSAVSQPSKRDHDPDRFFLSFEGSLGRQPTEQARGLGRQPTKPSRARAWLDAGLRVSVVNQPSKSDRMSCTGPGPSRQPAGQARSISPRSRGLGRQPAEQVRSPASGIKK
jgi:hypothetical protein